LYGVQEVDGSSPSAPIIYLKEDDMAKIPDELKRKSFEEKRAFKRINKHFLLTYFLKTNPAEKFEITQLKNISLGGVCFITSSKLEPGLEIGMELKTPYLADATFFEATVLESHENVKKILYQTRAIFNNVTPQGHVLLNKIMEVFINGETSPHA
jgi:hypothetical protein